MNIFYVQKGRCFLPLQTDLWLFIFPWPKSQLSISLILMILGVNFFFLGRLHEFLLVRAQSMNDQNGSNLQQNNRLFAEKRGSAVNRKRLSFKKGITLQNDMF